MKKFIYIIISLFLVACSDQDLNDLIADNILYNLNLSSENISVGPIDENHSIDINTNMEWSAQTSEDWIILENTSGNANSDLTFITKANPLAEERIGIIGVYCFGKHKKDITVRQGKVSLSVSMDTISFTSHQAEKSVSFQTEGTWTISSSSDWITVSQHAGNGNSSFSISVDEFMSSKNREGYVIIKDQSSQEKKITIFQKGKYLSLNTNYLSFLASGDNIETLNLDTDGTIEYSCDSWIKCEMDINQNITVKAIENTTGKTKNGIVRISLKDVSDISPIEVQIHQAPVKTTAQIVDLGLSVKWASYNIGAISEDDEGKVYHFGEGPEFKYNWEDLNNHIPPGVPDCVTGTKYDTANAFWGANWRIPTSNEWRELFSKCKMEEIPFDYVFEILSDGTILKVQGIAYKFIADNGNSIIIPEGHSYHKYISNGQIYEIGYKGHCLYWTATHENTNFYRVYPNTEILIEDYRPGYFMSVRAVWDD